MTNFSGGYKRLIFNSLFLMFSLWIMPHVWGIIFIFVQIES